MVISTPFLIGSSAIPNWAHTRLLPILGQAEALFDCESKPR